MSKGIQMAMACSDAGPVPSGRLIVRVQRVLQGDGSETRRSTVRCPHSACTRELDDCAACERSAGLSTEPPLAVLCSAPDAADEAAFTARVTAVRRDNRQDGEGAAQDRRIDDDTPPRDDEARLVPVAVLLGSEVFCVRDDVSIEALQALFVTRTISGVPVVDDAGRPIGVVSKTDLVRDAYERGDTGEIGPARPSGRRGVEQELGAGFHALPEGATVRDIMTPLAISLPEGASVAQAAALMAFEGVHRIPIVSEANQVVGLVSSIDILRWMAARSGFVVPRLQHHA